jgi:hypothetical protein
MASKYYLPSKVVSYLRRMLGEYKAEGESLYADILSLSKIYIHEASDFDNWNGGSSGHSIRLFMPPELLHRIPIRTQSIFTEKLLDDLRTCAEPVENEYFSKIIFESEDDTDPQCQQAIYLAQKPLPNPESLDIWAKGCIRLFISHRDTHKIEARELADALQSYGISAFVAHETIDALEKWQKVILQGLDSMEIMLAFITDDFHESVWTNQEVGYALARNIPILSLKIDKSDPQGFISDTQALKGDFSNIIASVPAIYKLIAKKLGNQNRLQVGLVDAFVNSPEWSETTKRFNRLEAHVSKLTEEELEKILNGYAKNDQLNTAVYLKNKNRLLKFLEKTSGKEFEMQNNKILLVDNENIPF